MAHKTLVGGTAYEISGGKTLIDGTGYEISKGKTLVGGTAYEVGFAPAMATVTFNLTSFHQYYGASLYSLYFDKRDHILSNGTENIEVPIGTEIKIILDDTECSSCGSEGEEGWEFHLNGKIISFDDRYTLTVKSDTMVSIEVVEDGHCYCGEPYAYITCKITEIPEGQILFNIKEYSSGLKTYYAEEGMTWGEWVDSEYSPSMGYTTKLYEVGFDGLIVNTEHNLSVMVSNNYTFPRSTDLITANGVYELAKD